MPYLPATIMPTIGFNLPGHKGEPARHGGNRRPPRDVAQKKKKQGKDQIGPQGDDLVPGDRKATSPSPSKGKEEGGVQLLTPSFSSSVEGWVIHLLITLVRGVGLICVLQKGERK